MEHSLEFYLDGEQIFGLYSDNNLLIKHDSESLKTIVGQLELSIELIKPFLK